MSSAACPLSLDKGSKCPTDDAYDVIDPISGELIGTFEPPVEKPVTGPGTCARLYYRPHTDEWKIQCEAETSNITPPQHSGARTTKQLSARGKRSISDSCEFVSITKAGYTTFLTLTFDPAARARMQDHIPDGPYCPTSWTKSGNPTHRKNVTYLGGALQPFPKGSNIATEVSRFFDTCSKIYKRGWQPTYERQRTRKMNGSEYTPLNWTPSRHFSPYDVDALNIGPGRSQNLDYLWVAENPLNDQGKRNPHVHVLLRWSVPWSLFPQWAKRIEQAWGQGFGHLEKIKDGSSAGYYIAKAANYLTKGAGSDSDQGPVRGNRYGISKSARAPKWQHSASWGWGNMAQLIGSVGATVQKIIYPLRRERDIARTTLAALPKTDKKGRNRAAAQLRQARSKLAAIPIWTGKYQIVIRGMELADRFLLYANANGWKQDPRPDSLWMSKVKQSWKSAKERCGLRRTEYSDANWASLLSFLEPSEPTQL